MNKNNETQGKAGEPRGCDRDVRDERDARGRRNEKGEGPPRVSHASHAPQGSLRVDARYHQGTGLIPSGYKAHTLRVRGSYPQGTRPLPSGYEAQRVRVDPQLGQMPRNRCKPALSRGVE